MARAPASAARKRNFTEDDLNDGETLRSDAYISVGEILGTKKKWFAHGYGTSNRFDGDTGYCYADLQADDGTGTIVGIEGTLRLVSYHSEDMEVPKAIMDEKDLSDLRESVNESRSDREIIPFQTNGKHAAEDEILAFEVKVTSTYDGHTLSAADCNVNLPYSEFRRT